LYGDDAALTTNRIRDVLSSRGGKRTGNRACGVSDSAAWKVPRMSTASGITAYQLRLAVRDVEPEIWRRILVRPGVTLEKLHRIIQHLMGWLDYHLHQYRIGGSIYAHNYRGTDYDVEEKLLSTRKPLSGLVQQGVREFVYEYDFGDGWEIIVAIEEIAERQLEGAAICLDGKRAGPLEDSGGPFGYTRLIEILGDPKHEEYRDSCVWANSMAAMSTKVERFDPEQFNIERVNSLLARPRAPR
jgi:Plasmid pRiA4b ORF-3-like protein